MAIVVSLINMKGGVGKTTVGVQLAHAADTKNFRTLAVDLDPQANLSQSLLTPAKYVKHLQQKKPTIVQLFDMYSPPTGASFTASVTWASDVVASKGSPITTAAETNVMRIR